MSANAESIAADRARATSWRLHLGWGIGTLGASLVLNGFSFLVPYYLTTVLGIGAATAATLLFIAKAWIRG